MKHAYFFALGLGVGALLVAAAAVYGESVGVSATVAATYSCEIKQFDLYCTTNAQKVFINGQQYER